ncbi:hypothetical protein AKO1_015067, partial [Acrasis kona]
MKKLSWNESKKSILLSLDTSKDGEQFTQELRLLKVNVNETVYNYNRRFYAYV